MCDFGDTHEIGKANGNIHIGLDDTDGRASDLSMKDMGFDIALAFRWGCSIPKKQHLC